MAAPVSPNRSLSWLDAMMIAMPMVKPLTTASGTKAIRLPARSSPASTRIAPAISVASTSPS